MADSPTLNQTLGRRREERAAEQLMQNSVNRLSNIAIDGLEVWRKYLSFGSSIAYYGGRRKRREPNLPRD